MKKRKENGSVIFRVCLGSDNDLHEAAGLGEGESRGRVEGEGIKHNIHWENTVEPLNKGHFGASFVPCREVVPISEVHSMVPQQVSFVERLSLSRR